MSSGGYSTGSGGGGGGGTFATLGGVYSDNVSLNTKIVAMDAATSALSTTVTALSAKVNANYNQLNQVSSMKFLTGN